MIPTRVLVVDEEPGVRAALARALASEGLEVHTASRALEALEKVDEVTPDIVLSDVKLPGMSGFELLQALRVRHDDLVVMLVNGDARAETVDAEVAGQLTAEISRVVSLVAVKIRADRRRRVRAALT
jgi:DNA-binding NtrC family response regulator